MKDIELIEREFVNGLVRGLSLIESYRRSVGVEHDCNTYNRASRFRRRAGVEKLLGELDNGTRERNINAGCGARYMEASDNEEHEYIVQWMRKGYSLADAVDMVRNGISKNSARNIGNRIYKTYHERIEWLKRYNEYPVPRVYSDFLEKGGDRWEGWGTWMEGLRIGLSIKAAYIWAYEGRRSCRMEAIYRMWHRHDTQDHLRYLNKFNRYLTPRVRAFRRFEEGVVANETNSDEDIGIDGILQKDNKWGNKLPEFYLAMGEPKKQRVRFDPEVDGKIDSTILYALDLEDEDKGHNVEKSEECVK